MGAHRRPLPDPVLEATRLARGARRVPEQVGGARYKVYANPQEVIHLPKPRRSGGRSLWDTFASPSGSAAEGGLMRQWELGQLLWAAVGILDGGTRAHVSPAMASGLEGYALVRSVKDLSRGVYHYGARDHALEQLSGLDPSAALAAALLDLPDLDPYAAALVVSGVPARWRQAYGARAARLLALEAGASVQAAALAAEGMGLAARLVANFFDDEVAALVQLDVDSEPPLAVMLVGR
jgi:SagB-type dehydrogenase family enzyme